MEIPKEAVVRVNMAWVRSISELEEILENNVQKEVFLDYPEGRAKPPKPILPIEIAYIMCNKYTNIKYFAVSNVEEVKKVKIIQSNLPEYVKFVPKIETVEGVRNLTKLISECKIEILMLDKEDLYTDVNKDNDKFFIYVDLSRKICKQLNVNLLELEGVTFATRS
jgi:3'-phosphoadenosine 5'-phosphosulfate sulfotransferase